MNNLQDVKQILIGADVAAVETAFADLEEGALAVFDENMVRLTPGATIDDSRTIYIARGRGDGYAPLLSFPIHAADVVDWNGRAYNAGVKKTWFLGNIGSGALALPVVADGGEFQVIVKSNNPESHSDEINTYTIVMAAGYTQEQLADAIVAKIMANRAPKARVVATKVNTGTDFGVKLEAYAVNQNFSVGYGGLFIDEDVSVTEGAMTFTIGRYADVAQLEQENLGYRGHTNRVGFPFTPITFAASGTNYDTYILQLDHMTTSGITDQVNPMTIFTFVPTNAATWDRAEFEATMNGWLESCPRSQSPVNL